MKEVIILSLLIIASWICFYLGGIHDAKKHLSTTNNTDLMNIYKAGYYSGAYRQKLGYNADSTFCEDSVLFEKHFFKPLNKEQ